MPFRFSLAAVLQYREAIEKREFVALEKIQLEIAQLEAKIQDAEHERSAMEKRRLEELTGGIRSIHLQDAMDKELIMERYRDDLINRRQGLVLKRNELLKAYEDARQKRELLEKLRDRKLERYTREQARIEQAIIDDLFLSRRRRTQ